MNKIPNTKLRDIACIIGGGTPKTSIAEYWGGNIPWLSVVDFNTNNRRVFKTDKTITQEGVDNSSTKILNKSDLIISARGTVGALAQLAKPMAFNQSCFGIRANDKSDNSYLYYAIKNNVNGLKKKSQGSVFSTINMELLENFDIPFPNIREQKSIADTLSALDDKIELNNSINARFENMARELYDYWFVQFDFPDENKRPYKSAGGAMIFDPILKREIPKGWRVEMLAENNLAKILKPGITKFDGEKTYLATACIENDRITDRSNKITFDNREGRANMQPIVNSVWFAKMKNTKKVLYFGDYSSERIAELIISTGMLGLQCRNYALEYIWNLINNDGFEVLKNKLSHGATQEGVNNDDLAFIPVVVPPQEILERYSTLVKPIYQQKYLNEQEAEHLATLRDFLLPMLMNGQVSVAN